MINLKDSVVTQDKAINKMIHSALSQLQIRDSLLRLVSVAPSGDHGTTMEQQISFLAL